MYENAIKALAIRAKHTMGGFPFIQDDFTLLWGWMALQAIAVEHTIP